MNEVGVLRFRFAYRGNVEPEPDEPAQPLSNKPRSYGMHAAIAAVLGVAFIFTGPRVLQALGWSTRGFIRWVAIGAFLFGLALAATVIVKAPQRIERKALVTAGAFYAIAFVFLLSSWFFENVAAPALIASSIAMGMSFLARKSTPGT